MAIGTRCVLATAAMSIAAIAAGCGDERTFSAQEFIEEANRHGAGLELGEPLPLTGSEDELYEVSLRDEHPAGGGHGSGGERGHEHGGGSLRVTDSQQAGTAEYRRCENTGLLLCYRVANVVLIFEPEAEPSGLARLPPALRAMESR
jgi:hypothetical protein